MSSKKMFAADFGASGGKFFLGEIDGETLKMQELHRFAHEGTSFYIENAKGELAERTFWDDVLIYGNIIAGLQAFKREVGGTLDSLGIDTWGADGQLMSADGDVLSKMYCYRDHRLDE